MCKWVCVYRHNVQFGEWVSSMHPTRVKSEARYRREHAVWFNLHEVLKFKSQQNESIEMIMTVIGGGRCWLRRREGAFCDDGDGLSFYWGVGWWATQVEAFVQGHPAAPWRTKEVPVKSDLQTNSYSQGRGPLLSRKREGNFHIWEVPH